MASRCNAADKLVFPFLENLKSLQKIVADPDNTVRLYGLVEQYDFLSVNNEKRLRFLKLRIDRIYIEN